MDVATDHRSMERFPLQLSARLFIENTKHKAEVLEARTKNICSGGAFFEAEKRLDLGTMVRVELVLSLDDLKKIAGNKALVKVKGTVIRSSEEGMAVSFSPNYEIRSLI